MESANQESKKNANAGKIDFKKPPYKISSYELKEDLK
jgi:hypothetical protein